MLNTESEYAPEELDNSIANTKWVTNVRHIIKNTCGTGWSVRGSDPKVN